LNCRIIDISQPISSATACFPGDTPFSREIAVSYESSEVMNLTSFSMSPHVGTHADSPLHIHGNLSTDAGFAADMELESFIGPVYVLDRADTHGEIQLETVQAELQALPEFPERILVKTQSHVRYDVFESSYGYFSPELIEYLASKGVRLLGIDTPSVDHVESKDLPSHHALLNGNMCWLENLDLSSVGTGSYYLVALPLKFVELEASPVRAVLLSAK